MASGMLEFSQRGEEPESPVHTSSPTTRSLRPFSLHDDHFSGHDRERSISHLTSPLMYDAQTSVSPHARAGSAESISSVAMGLRRRHSRAPSRQRSLFDTNASDFGGPPESPTRAIEQSLSSLKTDQQANFSMLLNVVNNMFAHVQAQSSSTDLYARMMLGASDARPITQLPSAATASTAGALPSMASSSLLTAGHNDTLPPTDGVPMLPSTLPSAAAVASSSGSRHVPHSTARPTTGQSRGFSSDGMTDQSVSTSAARGLG